MARTIQGALDATGKRFAVVVSRFNGTLTRRLLEGALDALSRHGVLEKDVLVAWVPGSFEIPLTAQRVAATGNYDAVICLGVILRGETSHFDHICAQVSGGIQSVALQTGVPALFGVVTADTLEQAMDRTGVKAGNKGFEAAVAAIEMTHVLEQIAQGNAIGTCK